MKRQMLAVALCAIAGAAGAQSLGYTPTAAEARQARDNAKRDAKLADAMEKARLKEDAKPVAVYIPKEEPKKEEAKAKKPETFTAAVPGSGKKAKEKQKKG
ncbi:hypothetical protein [Ramlibacter sp. PS4R-6]|uniref:hypothetical protein n=1 Tax=Ramlibacter sp. PS4R-6 TaxID=3133438 RepID=UPI0030A8C254